MTFRQMAWDIKARWIGAREAVWHVGAGEVTRVLAYRRPIPN